MSEATVTAYGRDWTAFTNWCSARELSSLPASDDTVLSYLSGLLDTGRRVKGCTRIATSIRAAHREAGHPVPWAEPGALVAALREKLPQAFAAQDPAESRTWREERERFLALLDRLGTQAPRMKLLAGYLARLVRDEHHLAEIVDVFFTDFGGTEASGEPRTKCDLCRAVVAEGRHATDEECRDHRCP